MTPSLPSEAELAEAEDRMHRALLLERFGPTRPELPEDVRAEKRKADRQFWRDLEELNAERDQATGDVHVLPQRSA